MPQTYHVGAPSRFVTFIAWVFIALALLVTVSALVRHAGLAALTAELAPALTTQPRPPLTGWLLAYLPWLTVAGLAASVAMLAAAVGLLLRLEWARRTFIALLGLVIAVNLAGLWLQQELMLSLVDATLHTTVLPPQVAGVFGGFVVAARSMAVLVTLAGCALLAGIAWRLTQPAVRQEFA